MLQGETPSVTRCTGGMPHTTHNSDYNAIKAAVDRDEALSKFIGKDIMPSAENRTDINMSNIKYHKGV